MKSAESTTVTAVMAIKIAAGLSVHKTDAGVLINGQFINLRFSKKYGSDNKEVGNTRRYLFKDTYDKKRHAKENKTGCQAAAGRPLGKTSIQDQTSLCKGQQIKSSLGRPSNQDCVRISTVFTRCCKRR